LASDHDRASGKADVGGWRAMLPSRAEWRWLLPSLVFITVTLISARFVAADYALEAMRYVVRLLAAALFLLVGLRLGRDVRQVRAVLWAIALGAGLSCLLGFGEALRWAPLTPLLELFKVAPTRVGGELRVSASFQYATIAAMYFEMVVPLAIVLAATSRRYSARLLGAGIAVICTANVVLSLTRAGMLTLLTIYALLLVIGCTRVSLRRVLWPSLAGAVTLVGGAALLFVHDPVFDLRLQTESDADWYGAEYSAPATLSLQADGRSVVDLDVRNAGRITWTSSGNHPFALGYRWLTADGTGVLDVTPTEVPLAHDVEPGETIRWRADVAVPDLPAGAYRLDWGMLQRDVLPFYERGWADAETGVSVASSASGGAMPAISPRDDEEAPWVVGRTALWEAAARLIAAHPLLGVGPDNFRHYYGAELGLEVWDERVQANNVYLEVLADLGVLGLAAFAWVVVGPLAATWRLALDRTDARGDGAAWRPGAGPSGQQAAGVEAVGADAGPSEQQAAQVETVGAGAGPCEQQAAGVNGVGVGAGPSGQQAAAVEAVGADAGPSGQQAAGVEAFGAGQQAAEVEAVGAGAGAGLAAAHGGAHRREALWGASGGEPARTEAAETGGADGEVHGCEVTRGGYAQVCAAPVAGGAATDGLRTGVTGDGLATDCRGPRWADDGLAAFDPGWRRTDDGLAYLALGVGLSIIAFLVHGLLDSFLAFNPTAWLFWLLLGFASVLGNARRD
jgi:hypothetical protein